MRCVPILFIIAMAGLSAMASAQNPCEFPYPDSCQFPDTCCAVAEVDCPWTVDGLNIVFLISWLKGGANPPIYSKFDFNCNCRINGADVLYLISYLKGTGPRPKCCFYQCQVRRRTGVMGDLVWNDFDADGLQDPGEDGMSNVAVRLVDCDDPTRVYDSTLTDADGHFVFDSVAVWNFRLQFQPPPGYLFSPANQGADDGLDSDVDPSTGLTACTHIDSGEVDLSWDAGVLCEMPPDSGCTRTVGYWKNHAGFGPQNDEITQYLPIWLGNPGDNTEAISVSTAQIAHGILSQQVYGNPSNGITKLYAQLLAAKLNISAGADGTDIADVIFSIDAFLADHSWEDWNQVSPEWRRMVLNLKDALESYNKGDTGPGGCDDE